MKHIGAVSVTYACRVNQARKSKHSKKRFQSFVFPFLDGRHSSNKCVEVLVMFINAYIEMWRLTSLLDVFCCLLVQSFNPNVIA